MVGSCLESYTVNQTVIELCSEEVAPCTGAVSQLVYKNKHCGECNMESKCINWNITVGCGRASRFEEQMRNFTSPLDIKRALDKNNCSITFKPDEFFKGPPCFTIRNDYLSKSHVDKCNVSGLWEVYDADIDWACANFITPFKNFKNVFCYICNPSQAKLQPVALIDNCNSLNTTAVSEACSTMPISERFAPFKNVFCYVCNQGYDFLYDEVVPSLQKIEEKNSLNLETQLKVSIKFNGDHTLEMVKDFLSNFVIAHLAYIRQDLIQSDTVIHNDILSSLNVFEKLYTSICGTGMLCYSNEERNITNKTYSNPVCKTCECDSSCSEFETCCPDILLTRQPYSCYSPTMFPTFYKFQAEQTQWGEIFRTESNSYANRYKTITTCLNEDAPKYTKEKCLEFNNKTDPFTLIPVSTDTGITYKNIYCYVCNSNRSTITLEFQALCNTYIEHKHFTNLNYLLKVIRNHCQNISFLPLQNKKCIHKYDSEKAETPEGEKFIRRKMHPSRFEFKKEIHIIMNATEERKRRRNVYANCNMTGKYSEGELSDTTKSICESDEVNLLSLPEYRVENSVYKNFACFLCNAEYDLDELHWQKTIAISHCLSKNSTEWYEPNVVLDDLCNETEFHQRWFPYKNMYCAECNLPPWQWVSSLPVPY